MICWTPLNITSKKLGCQQRNWNKELGFIFCLSIYTWHLYVKLKVSKDSLCYFIWSGYIFCNIWNSCHMSSAIPCCSTGIMVRTVFIADKGRTWDWFPVRSAEGPWVHWSWTVTFFSALSSLPQQSLVMGLSGIQKIQFSSLWNCLKAPGSSDVQAWECCWTSVGMRARAVWVRARPCWDRQV